MPATAVRESSPCQNRSTRPTDSLQRRCKLLLLRDLSFIPNEAFSTRTRIKPCQAWEDLKADAPASGRKRASGQLGELGADRLLTPEQESELFLRMNFLKFRAQAICKRLANGSPKEDLIDRAEALLEEADQIRNRLITSNMRLVMSIANKYVTPQHSFDDLVSDGTITLMNAVDKFDADRGFRFSTYAYRSIVRNLYRSIMETQKEKQRLAFGVEDSAVEQPDDPNNSRALDQVWQDIRSLAYSMLDNLDRRERFIIRSRYALGSHRKPRTFQYLADKLGISKERARQLEGRAVKKLQAMASGYDRDELFGAALS